TNLSAPAVASTGAGIGAMSCSCEQVNDATKNDDDNDQMQMRNYVIWNNNIEPTQEQLSRLHHHHHHHHHHHRHHSHGYDQDRQTLSSYGSCHSNVLINNNNKTIDGSGYDGHYVEHGQ